MPKSALLLACLASCGPGPAPEQPSEPPLEFIEAPPVDIPPPEPIPDAPPPPARSKSKYDPPVTLGHLDTTAPLQRKEIDDLIAVMFDAQAGRRCIEAKARLAAIGKPAFLPVLGRMARVRDTITDDDTMEERLVESSMKLADECLRGMDGYLDEHGKAPIRPGTDREYINYILRIHYRRWMEGMGSPPLKDRETMPGPFR